jgi:hypothetical protein
MIFVCEARCTALSTLSSPCMLYIGWVRWGNARPPPVAEIMNEKWENSGGTNQTAGIRSSQTFPFLIDHDSTVLNVGTIFSIVRFCLSAKWPYLMRALPSDIWDAPYRDTTIAKYIDSITLRTILEHMDIKQFRGDLDNRELDLLHTRLGLRLKNGGLGIHTVHDYCDSAMLGMWASNVDQIISSLGELTPEEDCAQRG